MFEYPKDEIVVKSVRDGLVDEIHSGFVVFMDKVGVVRDIKGKSGDYPFYMRSCAKPLQAALLIDYGMDKYYGMTSEEIALCCASHAGEAVHTDVLSGLLKKIGLDESFLKCGLHEPLSKTRCRELELGEILRLFRNSEGASPKNLLRQVQNDIISPIFNNCSGKHTMMLGLCRMKGWDLAGYYEPEHPLQVEIKKKIYELCELDRDYPLTTDGCGVPIVSMPLYAMLRGYLNLFCDERYSKIRDAFLAHPYLIGGEDRTDTKVMSACNASSFSAVVAKVGAGGLCVVVNIERREAFIVKISDSDMKSRELVVFGMINRLGWAEISYDNSIKTLHGDIVGNIVMDF